MEIKDLDQQERVVLAALVKFTVMSDGLVSEGEAGEIDAIVAELGEVNYQVAMDVAREKVTDLESLRQVLESVTRQEARELLYGTVIELSLPESIDPREGELLDLLSEVWSIQPEFEATTEESPE